MTTETQTELEFFHRFIGKEIAAGNEVTDARSTAMGFAARVKCGCERGRLELDAASSLRQIQLPRHAKTVADPAEALAEAVVVERHPNDARF
jgi:hypothetical protein